MRLIVETPQGDQAYSLAEGKTVIGRDRTCDIRIHDPGVSRRHLECTLTADTLAVKDLKTRNGTYLGTQRVEEAHVTPGLRLRLGTVHIRFEEDAPEPPRAQAAPLDDDFEQDDEPTPLDEHVAQSVLADAAGNGTRLVVRGNQWFVLDVATGTEVEIVPQGNGFQTAVPGETAMPGEAKRIHDSGMAVVLSRQSGATSKPFEPATATPVSQPFSLRALLADPRKRQRILLSAVGLVVLLILAVLWFKGPEKTELMTSARYRALVDEAVLAFRNGNRANAVTRLESLIKVRLQRQHKLADILLDAMKADEASLADFRAGFKEAQTRWEEARDSSEATEDTQDLARTRLDWITVELENMVHTNEARASLLQNDLSACLDRAAQVPEDSLFRAEAETLIGETISTVVAAAEKAATTAAAGQKWADAINELEKIKKYQPERESEIDPQVEAFKLRIKEQAAIAQARELAAESQYARAMEQLQKIAADSPYAKTAAALQGQYATAGKQHQAQAAYASGNGKRSLDLLSESGLGDSALALKVQQVLKHREAADKALEANDFDAAVEELKALLDLETDDQNKYRKDAKRQLDNMDQRRSAHAQKLMADAETANRERRFAEARDLYQKVIKIDPGSRTAAIAELDKLEDAAVSDYNTAIVLEKGNPQRALKLYQDVKDRLFPDHRFYGLADGRILKLELKMRLEEREP